MSVILWLLIPLSLIFATGFLVAFIWAVRSGQYQDTSTPSLRPLMDEPPPASGKDSTLKTKVK
jgi:cbb3-type cytochrome oxidase maturation protein